MMRLLAVLLALVPVAFGLIRLISTGSDARYLWSALAALFGASLVMIISRARERSRNVVAGLFLVALSVSTLLAALVARLLGATSAPAIVAVAVAFGMCCTTGAALRARTPR